MSEMVGIVARAIAQHIGPHAFDDLPKDKPTLKLAQRAGDAVFDSQDDILEIAHAAIEAVMAAAASAPDWRAHLEELVTAFAHEKSSPSACAVWNEKRRLLLTGRGQSV